MSETPRGKPGRKRRRILRILLALVALGVLGAVAAGGATVYAFYHYGKDLPDHRSLVDYEPAVATRVYAGDGSPMAEFAVENRVFVPIEAIPDIVKQAFIAVEDQNFHEHWGIDPIGVVRAAIANLGGVGEGRRLQGASTVTQQVAKNFFLTNEVSYARKIKEAILALRIEHALSKDRILELYLNEIYLGFGSYGVAAAALNYFNKPLDELTLEEVAYLAALPKAPNNYHPIRRARDAIERRNWVIGRMVEEGYAGAAEARAARSTPLGVDLSGSREPVAAAYATEEIRREVADRYGGDALYEGGLYIRSTIAPALQDAARRALRAGLSAYDMRHGWRGPLAAMTLDSEWAARLGRIRVAAGLDPWRAAVVRGMNDDAAVIGLDDGGAGIVLVEDMAWARARLENGGLGPSVARPSQVLSVGDVVLVEPVDRDGERNIPEGLPVYALRQFPEASGGIVAMDPHTGRVLAMEGGFSFDDSEFNRATQAMRQPGSAFKPFVYMAALDHGFTPASLVEDAPFAFNPGEGQDIWKPSNYTEEFHGPTPLRVGIERSRNLMTVRLANIVGPDIVAGYASDFGVIDKGLPFYLPMALGAAETTLLELTAAYAMIVNGGKRIEPALIERIQDRNGYTIWRRDERVCDACSAETWSEDLGVPRLPDPRERVVDPRTAYQMVHILEGVVRRGTGARLRELGRPLAGKTGTTNENREAWFVGFSPDLAVGVYVGFDRPESLGERETGASVAVPIWKAFVAEALENEPVVPFRIPPGIRLVRIDGDRGLLPGSATGRVIVEAFRPGTEPTETADGAAVASDDAIDGLDAPMSGIY